MTLDGVVRGDARQQVDVKRTGDDADANPTSSQVLGNLADKGIRNGANDSFTPNAVLGGQDAIQQYLQSGLLQIKGDPKATAQLGALLQNKDGASLTYQDASGKLSLTVAGQAKVQAVFNTLKLTETFDVKNFPDQQTAQIVTLVAAVVLTVCTGGAAAGTLGAFLTTAGTASAAMINAAVIAMASTMVGQMAGGASFGQAFEAGLKAGATSALMAGVSFGVSDALGLNAQYDAAGNVMKDTQGNVIYQTANGANYAKLTALQKLGDSNWWAQAGASAAASGVVAEINGGNFTQGFTGGMLGSLSASGAGVIGDQTQGNALANISAHAVLGCASAAASGKDCGSGALGGAASASLARIIDGAMKGSDLSDTTKRAVIAGGSVLGSVAIAGAAGKETLTAGSVAANEVLNNFLGDHSQAERDYLRAKAASGQSLTTEESTRLAQLEIADQMSDSLLRKEKEIGYENMSAKDKYNLDAYLSIYKAENGSLATQVLIKNGPASQYAYPYAGSNEDKSSYMDKLRASNGGGVAGWLTQRPGSANEDIFISAMRDSGMGGSLLGGLGRNEDYLPSALRYSNSTIAALANSPALATGVYLVGKAIGLDQGVLDKATQFASQISDVGASFVLPRAVVSPVFGQQSVVSVKTSGSSGEVLTSLVGGVKVVDQRTGVIFQGTVDLQPTLERISSGGAPISRNDGAEFKNNPVGGVQLLPQKPSGYYSEYVVLTPGVNGPGPQRMVVGKGGEIYYTPDHYNSFVRIKE